MAQIILGKAQEGAQRVVQRFYECRNEIVWNLGMEAGVKGSPAGEGSDARLRGDFDRISTVIEWAQDQYGICMLDCIAESPEEEELFDKIGDEYGYSVNVEGEDFEG